MGEKPVYLFYSYAHEDEDLRNELVGHLKIMERRGVVRSWHDRKIVAGDSWDNEINDHLKDADLILLLISSDFIQSDYIWGNELEIAMKRHQNHEASVVPIMLRSVDIEGAPFAVLQGLPKDFKPVTSWDNRDEAWTSVAKGIRKVVKEIQANHPEVDEITTPAPSVTRGVDAPFGIDDLDQNPELFSTEETPKIFDDFDDTEAPKNISVSTLHNDDDPILLKIVNDFTLDIDTAAKQRKTTSINKQIISQSALELINNPEQKRILWVDNQAQNNQWEIAALAKLQIEVITLDSTQQALDYLADDEEGIDLIICDWSRPEALADAPSAGIKLLRALKEAGYNIPVIIYHGEFDKDKRASRHKQAMAEGAVGEEISPDELIAKLAKWLSMY